MSQQQELFPLPRRLDAEGRPEIMRDDPMPTGPYSVGYTHWEGAGDGFPYTVRCGDGRAIAGQVNSLACAQAIVDALNALASAAATD